MRRQSNWLARAASAAGLLATSWLIGPARAQEPADPLPGPASETRTVGLLDAQRDGLVELEARGKGDDQVRLVIRSNSPNRLNIVLPPALVASASAGQPGGLGGGFQSMGLGAPTDQPGAFGQFRDGNGFRSLAADGDDAAGGIAIPAGQTVDLTVPAVCLNFGIPTPTPKDAFTLVAVEDYTPDERARKALRTLSTMGTSQKVAQAVAWNVFNGVTFPQMAEHASKKLNPHELALAARFVEALDMSGGTDVVDPAYLQQARVFVRVQGTGADVDQLARDLGSQSIFGLPVQVVDERPGTEAGLAVLFLNVELADEDARRMVGRVTVHSRAVDRDAWVSLGSVGMPIEKPSTGLDAATLADTLDRTLAGAFVKTRVVRRTPGRTTIAIENRLPLTIASLTLRAGQSEDLSGLVDMPGLGLGPARTTATSIPAARGVAERVVFNGL